MIRLYHTATLDWYFNPHEYVIYDTETEKCEGIPTELLSNHSGILSYTWFTPTDALHYVEAPTLADILSSYPELLI